VPAAPREIVVDSGPIIALFDAGDRYHADAIEFVRGTRARLATTLAVVTEAMYVLDESLTAQRSLLAWIHAGGLTLHEPDAASFARIGELLEKYGDLPMDFADAVTVELCERLGIIHIASVDRHFDIYRIRGRTRLVNVFFQ
jgi:predicted nucleic acid-binding protein